jgi:hypothetical protein
MTCQNKWRISYFAMQHIFHKCIVYGEFTTGDGFTAKREERNKTARRKEKSNIMFFISAM